tara:strand:+ start:403 stop:618 length:216 start_codon:yes stop_codon:yes gene_type:complete
MPDSADYAFNQMEDNACKFDEAEQRWDKMKVDEKVSYFQEKFGDEPIVDFLENDDDIMESIFAKLVADENE